MRSKVRTILTFVEYRYKTFAHQIQLILLILFFVSNVGYFQHSWIINFLLNWISRKAYLLNGSPTLNGKYQGWKKGFKSKTYLIGKYSRGIPTVGQWDWWHLCSARTKVPDMAQWFKRIQCCCSSSLGCKCGLDLVPCPKSSICGRTGKNEKKENIQGNRHLPYI